MCSKPLSSIVANCVQYKSFSFLIGFNKCLVEHTLLTHNSPTCVQSQVASDFNVILRLLYVLDDTSLSCAFFSFKCFLDSTQNKLNNIFTLRYVHLKSACPTITTTVIAHTQYIGHSDWKF